MTDWLNPYDDENSTELCVQELQGALDSFQEAVNKVLAEHNYKFFRLEQRLDAMKSMLVAESRDSELTALRELAAAVRELGTDESGHDFWRDCANSEGHPDLVRNWTTIADCLDKLEAK